MKNATRRPLTAYLSICAAVLVAASSAAAQDVAAGTRVRITYDSQRSGVQRIVLGSYHQAIGTLVRQDSAGYAVGTPGREMAVPAHLVRRVDVSQGRRRNVAAGALVGVGAGAAAIVSLHFLIVAPLGGEWGHNQQVYLMIPAGSAVVGAALAYLIPQERWQRRL